MAVDAVSVAKSARLGEDLSHLDLLFLNRDEARALTGMQEAAAGHAATAGARCGRVVLTEGQAGVHALADGPPLWAAAPAIEKVNVSGAGDALIAGTLLRLAEDASLAAAVEFGAACAALTVSSPDAVAPDCRARTSDDRSCRRAALPRSDDAHER